MKFVSALLVIVIALYVDQLLFCRGDEKKVTISVGDLKIEVSIHNKSEEKKDNGEEEDDDDFNEIRLPKINKDGWKKYRDTLNASSPDELITNDTSLFDEILITNAFERSETDDGNLIYQGDIIRINESLALSDTKKSKRAVNAYSNLRWRNNRVPYKINKKVKGRARRTIYEAIREWQKRLPCMKWVEKSDSDFSYVHFIRGSGCYSAVGRVGGEQKLSVGKGCGRLGIVLHEMGHTLGLYHEQSRPDRGQYIRVVKKNILEGFEYQFEKLSKQAINSYGSSYDYGSIMHYSATAFAKKPNLVTIEAKSARNVVFGQRYRLSAKDIKQANAMYQCGSSATPTSRLQAGTPPKKLDVKDQAMFNDTNSTSTSTEESPITVTTESLVTTPSTSVSTELEPQTTQQLTTSTTETTVTTQAATVNTEIETRTTPPSTILTTEILVTTPSPSISTEKELEPTSSPPTMSTNQACDILSTCHQFIKQGHCSTTSLYHYLAVFFCRKTCATWNRLVEENDGETCVDVEGTCLQWSEEGRCNNSEKQEYMETMCCSSCRQYNCEDRDPFCKVWSEAGDCNHKYVQKNCKKSCKTC